MAGDRDRRWMDTVIIEAPEQPPADRPSCRSIPQDLTLQPHEYDHAPDQRAAQVQGEGHDPCRLGPKRDRTGRGRNARLDVITPAVRQGQAIERGPYRRLPAHDHPDRCADRDLEGTRRRGQLEQLQHLQHAGPCRSSHRCCGDPGVCVEGDERDRIRLVY